MIYSDPSWHAWTTSMRKLDAVIYVIDQQKIIIIAKSSRDDSH
jgi:hypothetical protein